MKKYICDNCGKELEDGKFLQVVQDMKVIEPGKETSHGVYMGYEFCDSVCLVNRLSTYYRLLLIVHGE